MLPCFSPHHFSKGDNFLIFQFASLDKEILLKGVYLYRKEMAPSVATFSLRSDPYWEERQKENARVASLEVSHHGFYGASAHKGYIGSSLEIVYWCNHSNTVVANLSQD